MTTKTKCKHIWSPWRDTSSTFGADQGLSSVCTLCEKVRFNERKEYSQEDWEKESIEDRLLITSRVSNASLEHCKLMDEAYREIFKLRKEVQDLEMKLDSLQDQLYYRD